MIFRRYNFCCEAPHTKKQLDWGPDDRWTVSSSIYSGTPWECRLNSPVTWRQRCAGAPSCWKMISFWGMPGNNPFKDIFIIIRCLILLKDVWKRLTFSKFWYSSWYYCALWKMISALQQSFVSHTLLCTHICVHKITLRICRCLDGEHCSFVK